MTSFFESVVTNYPQEKLRDTLFVYPTKRSASLFKTELIRLTDFQGELPLIMTWSELVDYLSPFRTLSKSESLIHLYASTKDEINLPSFLNWGDTVLADFESLMLNDLQGVQVLSESNLFKVLEKWNLDENKISQYRDFWTTLPELYQSFYSRLHDKQLQTNASKYHNALKQLSSSGINKRFQRKTVCFCGFTAFSPIEQQLIALLSSSKEELLFYDNPTWPAIGDKHEAKLFEAENATFFKQVKEVGGEQAEQSFHAYECTNSFEAVKVVSKLLVNLNSEEIQKTAVVLLNDDDIPMLLNSIPDSISDINLGLGKPLYRTSPGSCFNLLMHLHQSLKVRGKITSEDLLELLSHPEVLRQIGSERRATSLKVVKERNRFDFKSSEILGVFEDPWMVQIMGALSSSTLYDFVQAIYLMNIENWLLINQLIEKSLLQTQQWGEQLEEGLFKMLLDEQFNQTKISIEGRLNEGLQILSLLESRCLDFERLIFLSFHDENLPQSKSNTYLPFEIQRQYKLPDQKHRESILAYHFMRLLKRSKDSTFIYTTGTSGFTLQTPSRFLLQAWLEWGKSSKIKLTKHIVDYQSDGRVKQELSIEKSDRVYAGIKDYLFNRGLSPSALNVYLNNPMDFLLFHILGLREKEEVTFNIESSTIGTIVHDALEQLYIPFVGKNSAAIEASELVARAHKAVEHELIKFYPLESLSSGRLNILVPVMKQWVKKFIQYDLGKRNPSEYTLLGLEKQYKSLVQHENLEFRLKGIVDRIERVGPNDHLVDYKTGNVHQSDLNLSREEMLHFNPEKTKAYQLLLYTYIYRDQNPGHLKDSICSIYSFRNHKAGFLNLRVEKSPIIGTQELDLFVEGLSNMLGELLDPQVPIQLKKYRYQKFEV